MLSLFTCVHIHMTITEATVPGTTSGSWMFKVSPGDVCDVFTCGWGSAGMWPKPESVSQDQNGYQGDKELPLYGSRAALFPRIPAFLVFWVDGQTSFLLGSALNWTVPSLWTRTTALTVPTLSDLLLLYWLCFSLFLLFLKFWWSFLLFWPGSLTELVFIFPSAILSLFDWQANVWLQALTL